MFKRKHSKIQKQTDTYLLEIYSKTGNLDIFAQLFERYSHLLFGLCMKYLKNEEEAKDAVMQIFERLIVDLKKYRVENFKSWIYTYSKNHCLALLRKKQKKIKKERDYFLENKTNSMENDLLFHHNNENEDKLKAMETAMQKLKPEQKQCLELFYLADKSYQEISDKTGYSLKAVKSHVQNGKRMLKKLSENELVQKKDE